ncbi:hypothetical protein D3C85_1907400 [compost metagenome]
MLPAIHSRLTRSSSVNDFSFFSTAHSPACTTCVLSDTAPPPLTKVAAADVAGRPAAASAAALPLAEAMAAAL